MKSKLTLRIDEDVKRAAKAIARERGESVSSMVEAYFQLLASETDETKGSGEQDLGPITRRIAGALDGYDSDEESDSVPTLHGSGKEEDRRIALKAALKKHG
jgi:hypothetical protein